jgi:hypothetical protein
LLAVDPAGFVGAGDVVGRRVAGLVQAAGQRLSGGLGRSGAMAGSDPAGRAWAAAYDETAAALLAGTQDALGAALQLAGLLAQTGVNYARAEAHSAGQEPPAPAGSYDRAVFFGALPSAAGGAVGPPTGWSLVGSLVAHAWPNGHQDRLLAAARCWQAAAEHLYDAAFAVTDAVYAVAQQSSPEVDTAIAVCNQLRDVLAGLAAEHKELGAACAGYAHQLDRAHHEVVAELTSLLEWTAGIEGVGLLVGVFSFGAGMVSAQGVEAGRVAATAVRISTVLARLAATAQDAAAVIRARVGPVAHLAERLRPLLNARRVPAETIPVRGGVAADAAVDELVAAARVPDVPLRISRRQIESHYKHATDFGVEVPRGVDGFTAFQRRVQEFVAAPGRIRVLGKYRGRQVILTYDESSMLVVIQSVDGSFISGWSMTERQLFYIKSRGVLGGD